MGGEAQLHVVSGREVSATGFPFLSGLSQVPSTRSPQES
jgi:hypothetical protein